MNLMSAELTEKQFNTVRRLIYDICGIYLKKNKQALVRARLMKRLRVLHLNSFDAYFSYLQSESGRQEISFMVDVMTTNKTHFFREPEHFTYFQSQILPRLQGQGQRLRFWTAACSSGEEAYSLAMLLREHLPGIDGKDVKILATDISRQMLEKARNAVYSHENVKDVPPMFVQKYFVRHHLDTPGRYYRVKENVRRLVHIAWLNLIEPWPMKGKFDIIFCRNVMIYFDRQTQEKLVNRFWDILVPGGHLFVGHSEGLSAVSHDFHYVRPAVYMK